MGPSDGHQRAPGHIRRDLTRGRNHLQRDFPSRHLVPVFGQYAEAPPGGSVTPAEGRVLHLLDSCTRAAATAEARPSGRAAVESSSGVAGVR